MGVYINLDIMPNQIDKKEWEDVYKESLELVEAYPFMDNIIDKKTYECPWVYVDRAKETTFEEFDFTEPQIGWHVFGDFDSMLTAESFALYKNLDYYRKKCHGNGDRNGDILSMLIKRNAIRIVKKQKQFHHY
ncbi:hypothetical protein ACW2QC_17045 [Virgibacillus sp. FSP13]